MAAFLTACTSHVEVPVYADITFTHKDPILLDVARIEVIDQYQSPGISPNVEQEFPVSIEETAKRWARDRLKAAGSSGTATVRILDASVTEQQLEVEDGLTGLLTTDQSEKYSARLLIEIRAENPSRNLTGSASAEALRSRTVLEGLTLNEREKVWYEMAENISGDMDQQMEQAIRDHMSAFITR